MPIEDLILRRDKGLALTFDEVDDNFQYLEDLILGVANTVGNIDFSTIGKCNLQMQL